MPAFHSLKEKQIPNRASVGDIFYATDSKRTFFGLMDGTVICLQDFFTLGQATARCIGPQGEKGDPGIPGSKGEKGDRGDTGATGAPGRDAVGAAGPQGRAGADGAPGKDAPQRVELDNLLIESRREIKSLRQEMAALESKVQALVDMNNKAGEYMEWLRAKAAARVKSV